MVNVSPKPVDYVSARERTACASLGVSAREIRKIALTHDGMLPPAGSELATDKPFVCRHLPPDNPVEQTLLSMWINTHQAMFISVAIAAHCVRRLGMLLAHEAPLEEIAPVAQRAADCRLASAAYTSLPFLRKELYECYIRESMKTVHPGFSGVSNLEAIVLEKSLRALKESARALPPCSYREAVNDVLASVYDADREWWRWHGRAMSTYVEVPVSLARLDFQNRPAEKATARFEDYRSQVLRDDAALADYDRYFAVERTDGLTLSHYRSLLARALARSDPFIERSGPLAEYRAQGEPALLATLDLEIA